MAELVQGLNDAADIEYARVRTELREAIAHSGYTLEQIAASAEVSVGTLRNAVNGANAIGIDKLVRILIVLNARLQVVENGAGALPFRMVPAEVRSLGRRRSQVSQAASQGSDVSETQKPAKTRYRAKRPQRSRKTGTEGASNHCFRHTLVDLRERIEARREVSLQRTFCAHPDGPGQPLIGAPETSESREAA